ncbi:ninjurin-2 isoform X4 [Photinus pyralis]|uniref:ninjurin-2 isoform X4 n=1 Tax=Photinus pyralis TaxID=7054 RepID=UPI001267684A|nr:ninjurin-2 isoform X4 [Photinus pyralis]
MSQRPNGSDQPDGNVVVAGVQILKTLDANRYATKKTIAQGLLDVALLTANASQLKYVLQVGKQHEFYTLMLSLIIVSIVLQTFQALLCIFLGARLNINKESHQDTANRTNNIVLCVNIVVFVVNIVLEAFNLSNDRKISPNTF